MTINTSNPTDSVWQGKLNLSQNVQNRDQEKQSGWLAAGLFQLAPLKWPNWGSCSSQLGLPCVILSVTMILHYHNLEHWLLKNETTLLANASEPNQITKACEVLNIPDAGTDWPIWQRLGDCYCGKDIIIQCHSGSSEFPPKHKVKHTWLSPMNHYFSLQWSLCNWDLV